MLKEPIQIGSKIRRLREYQRLTQEHVATGLGISQQAYSKLESDTSALTVNQLIVISELLGVSPGSLLDEDAHKVIFHFSSNNNNKGTFSAGMHTPSHKAEELYEQILALLKNENEALTN